MSLPAGYPSSLDSLANPTATTNRDDPGFELDAVIARIQDILEALEAKVGIGASLPSGTGVLRRTAPGATGWGQVVGAAAGPGSGDIAPQTIYGGQAGGNSNITPGTVVGTDLLVATLTSRELAAAAASQIVRATPSSSSPAYAAASLAVIPEMSVSITTVGGLVLVLYYGTHYGSVVGTTFIMQPHIDGVAQNPGLQFIIQSVNAHFPVALIAAYSLSGSLASPTAHTIDIRQSIGGGGGVVAYSIWRSLTVVELRR